MLVGRISFTMMMLLTAGSIQAQDRLYCDEFPLGDVTLLDGPLKKARPTGMVSMVMWEATT